MLLVLAELSGVLLSVVLLLQSSGTDEVKTKLTIQTFKPRTFGETRSERKLKRLDKLRDAVCERDSPVDLEWRW